MYKYLSNFDNFLVMVKIFEKYSYIKKLKITHKNGKVPLCLEIVFFKIKNCITF